MTTTTHPAWRGATALLREHAPALVAPFREALPRAADTVARRLVGALHREGLARWTGPGTRHAFDRVEPELPGGHLPEVADPGLAAELTSAVVNLALAYARPRPPSAGADPDGHALDLERLAVDGHNLHPCGRTRLGWDVGDGLRHDVEAGHVPVAFVAVHRGLMTGDDLGAALGDAYPGVPAAPPGYVVQPVHPWERDAVLRRRHAALYRTGALRDLDGTLPAAPTAALRTLLLPPGRDGRRRYVKVALDVQVTSTRRTISTASARNGPVLSGLLARLGDEVGGDRVLLLAETHGAAFTAGDGRDASAILRAGLGGALGPGETAVPGGALPVAAVLDPLVAAHPGGARGFLADYARLLLPPVVTLAARYGIGFEAHLQNCLPTFKDGRPHRIVLRDLAGLRLHPGRLEAAGHRVALWPGSAVVTGDVDVMRAKVAYTALQAHLGELVIRLDLDEGEAWREVRSALDEAYDPLMASPDARADHAFLTAPRVPHKALVRMRLAGRGDLYVPVQNPLHGR